MEFSPPGPRVAPPGCGAGALADDGISGPGPPRPGRSEEAEPAAGGLPLLERNVPMALWQLHIVGRSGRLEFATRLP